jgi:hypothetical protein
MVLGDDTALELPGALLAGLGALVVAAAVRCRRSEVLLGERWLELRTGPLRQRVPLDWLGEAAVRPATSWRRLYADHEVVIDLTTGGRQLVAPSRQPADLKAALPTPDAD